MRRLENAFWLAFAVPTVGIVLVLFFAPFLYSAFGSFQGKSGQLTLDNYALVARLYTKDVLYTVGIAAFSLAIVLFIGILLCGYLRVYGNKLVEFLFKIPLFVPFVVVGHAMRVFLAPHGILNSMVAQIGLINLDNPPSLAYSWLGISLALAWKNMAMAVLLILGAFRSVHETYLEAARNFGAGAIRQTLDVLLPMSASSLAVASVLMFTSMLASFSIPLMIGGGKGAQMTMIDVYYRITYQGDYGAANALGVISYLLASGAAIYYLRTVTRK